MPLSKSAAWRKEVKDVFSEGGFTLGEAAKQASRRRSNNVMQLSQQQQPQQQQQQQPHSPFAWVKQIPDVKLNKHMRFLGIDIEGMSRTTKEKKYLVYLKKWNPSAEAAKQVSQSHNVIQPPRGQRGPRKIKDYKPITIEEARAAFNEYYTAENRTRPSKKNPKGRLRFNNVERSKKYDLDYTKNSYSKVIADERYLLTNGPSKYDFQNVDTGPKRRRKGSLSA